MEFFMLFMVGDDSERRSTPFCSPFHSNKTWFNDGEELLRSNATGVEVSMVTPMSLIIEVGVPLGKLLSLLAAAILRLSWDPIASRAARPLGGSLLLDAVEVVVLSSSPSGESYILGVSIFLVLLGAEKEEYFASLMISAFVGVM
jgi:hypothetical protein